MRDAGAAPDLEHQTDVGQVVQHGIESVDQLRRHDHGDGIGVVEEVVELGFRVAVVDVDRNSPDLEARERRLEVLGAVVEEEGDLVVGADPGVRQD